VSDVVRRLIEEGIAPSAAAGAAARGRSGEPGAHGGSPAVRDCVWASVVEGATGAYFDLASVTKPMTALAVGWSGLDVRTPLGDLVEEARGTPSAGVSIELLLAHRAGLEAHLPLYEPLTRGETVDARAALTCAASARRDDVGSDSERALHGAPERAPEDEGFAPLYSDLGYLLAGVALARHVGARDAGEAIERVVVARLGLEGQLGTARALEARGVDLASRAAPTEDVPWRGGVVCGRVHDENAWALSGAGGSGHAGMFGTIDAVLRFGCAAHDAIEADARLAWMVRARPGGTLRAGWDGKSAAGSSAGERMGPRAFGHLGFTGTSLWIEPDARVVVALLTNRVHPTREHVAIRAARPGAHDALFARAMQLVGEQRGER
jgi:serine-type D-Ala-D-Ala carboxypeptidase